MIDATHLKAHRTAAGLLEKGAVPRRLGRTKGGLNWKEAPPVCDQEGKPLILLLTEGQVSDYRGAATVLPDLPEADVLFVALVGDQHVGLRQVGQHGRRGADSR